MKTNTSVRSTFTSWDDWKDWYIKFRYSQPLRNLKTATRLDIRESIQYLQRAELRETTNEGRRALRVAIEVLQDRLTETNQ